MSKQTIKGFIVWEKWKDAPNSEAVFRIQSYKPSGTSECYDTVLVREQAFEVDVPDTFNPVPAQVAALEATKRMLRLKLAQELAMLDERISKLTCIEHSAVEVGL